MSKKTKIILTKTEENVGVKGSIVNVNSGYAFNYLLPKKIAELATPGKLKHFKMLKSLQNQQLEISKTKAKTILSNLQQITQISIKKKIGDNQQIFGRVHEKEILNKILKLTGHTLDKKQIKITDIKQTGKYKAYIHILDEIEGFLQVQVIPETTNNNL